MRSRECRRILPLICGLLIPFALLGAAEDRPIAFRDATIETITKGRIERGNVVIRGGKIEAVGPDAKIPDNARVIDARGMTIMPGIVDPYSRAGLSTPGGTPTPPPFPAVPLPGFPPVAPPTTTVFTRAADHFYPYQSVYKQLVRSGITTVSLVPPGFGQAASIRLAPDRPDEMMLAPDGLLFTTVSNQTQSLEALRGALKRAKSPPGSKPAPPKSESGTAGTESAESKDAAQAPPDSSAASTSRLWADVAAGKRTLLLNASSAAAVAHLAKVVEPYPEVKLTLVASGAAVYQSLDVLKKRKPRLILVPDIDLRPNSRDRINVPRAVHEAGLEFAFTLTSSLQNLEATQDAPIFPVAYLVHTGLPREVALQALTFRPAEIVGLADRLGSIEPKKDANLLVFSGDPLDPMSRLRQVMVEGRIVYEN